VPETTVPETTVRWVSAFIDVAPDLFDASLSYWTAVTGSTPGEAVGDRGEFQPLVPSRGDPCLWLQRIDEGPTACHPDLYVEDVEAAAERAVGLGATRVSTTEGLVVMRSPGLLPFCLVRHRDQSDRPDPTGPEGARGIVDQICLDIPPGRFEEECAFWAALSGWVPRGERHTEFERLLRPPAIPYAFLLQRLDEEQPAVSAHLDLACEDRDAVTAQHQALRGELVRRTHGWTVMRDPTGLVYCNTGRRPGAV
jgi:hypothetical protein